jgi:hypothetical protein
VTTAATTTQAFRVGEATVQPNAPRASVRARIESSAGVDDDRWLVHGHATEPRALGMTIGGWRTVSRGNGIGV